MENGDKVAQTDGKSQVVFKPQMAAVLVLKGILKVDIIYTMFIQKYKQCFPSTCGRCLRGKTELTESQES